MVAEGAVQGSTAQCACPGDLPDIGNGDTPAGAGGSGRSVAPVCPRSPATGRVRAVNVLEQCRHGRSPAVRVVDLPYHTDASHAELPDDALGFLKRDLPLARDRVDGPAIVRKRMDLEPDLERRTTRQFILDHGSAACRTVELTDAAP